MQYSHRHELRFGALRYLLCRAFEARQLEGRPLAPRDATRVISGIVHGGHGGHGSAGGVLAVRAAFADLSHSPAFRVPSDLSLVRWFGQRLGLTLPAQLVLVQLDHATSAGSLGTLVLRRRSRTRAQLLASDFATEHLVHDGRSYRLVVAEGFRGLKDAHAYEPVERNDAVKIVTAMAGVATSKPAARTRLGEAHGLLTKAPHVASKQELILLRRRRAVVGRDDSSNDRPSQPPRRLSDDITWLEIRLVDATGQPVGNQGYLVKLPDGSSRSGTLDGGGTAYLAGITPPGSCEVTFPGFAPRVV